MAPVLVFVVVEVTKLLPLVRLDASVKTTGKKTKVIIYAKENSA